MGGTRTRKDKACMLVAAADEICRSRDSKISKYIFEPFPIRDVAKCQKNSQMDQKKPGQIRTTRSSKLITRPEADMASVEGN